jgi:hypothetical protein
MNNNPIYFCGDDNVGALGNSIEEAFAMYKQHLDNDVTIKEMVFFRVDPKSFYCSTKIIINE